MKTNLSLRRLALGFALLLPTSLQALEVHELGRFANGAAEIVSEREKMKTLGRYSMLWNHMHQNVAK